MAYKFVENINTETIHLIEYYNEIITDDNFLCGAYNPGLNDIKYLSGLYYDEKKVKIFSDDYYEVENIKCAERALALFKNGHKLCGRCIGMIYGNIDT